MGPKESGFYTLQEIPTNWSIKSQRKPRGRSWNIMRCYDTVTTQKSHWLCSSSCSFLFQKISNEKVWLPPKSTNQESIVEIHWWETGYLLNDGPKICKTCYQGSHMEKNNTKEVSRPPFLRGAVHCHYPSCCENVWLTLKTAEARVLSAPEYSINWVGTCPLWKLADGLYWAAFNGRLLACVGTSLHLFRLDRSFPHLNRKSTGDKGTVKGCHLKIQTATDHGIRQWISIHCRDTLDIHMDIKNKMETTHIL